MYYPHLKDFEIRDFGGQSKRNLYIDGFNLFRAEITSNNTTTDRRNPGYVVVENHYSLLFSMSFYRFELKLYVHNEAEKSYRLVLVRALKTHSIRYLNFWVYKVFQALLKSHDDD